MESAAIRDVKSAGDEKEEQQEEPVENSRYICKICSKKFASGRALGGHMRAHGPVAMAAAAEHSERLGVPQEFQKKRSRVPEFQAGEDDECNKSIEEEQEDDDDEEKEFHLNGNNPMYALRRNPKRSWRFADRDYLFLVHAESDVSASKIGNSSTYLRNSRICEVCGKEFSSWKALFGHMRCHSDRLWKSHQDREGDDGDCLEKNWEISQKSESREEEEEEEEEEESEESESDTENEQPQSVQWPTGNSSRFDQWMKGKRSRRPRCTVQPPPPPPPQPGQSQSEYNDEENMAICLVMLSSGVNTMEAGKLRFSGAEEVVGTSGSRDMQVVPHTGENASELQKCIKKRPKSKKIDIGVNDACDDVEFKRSSYKCSTCNKVFHSYQALGGHRASHKKVKGCSSRLDLPEENGSLEEEITDEELITRSSHQLSIDFHKPPPKTQSKDTCSEAREESDETTIPVTLKASNKKSKVHECSICHRVFGSGQALGGHKRCHWGGAGTSDTISTVSSIKDPPQQQQRPARVELLDLNLPAPVDDDDDGLQIEDAGQLNNFGGIVVDSHRPSDAEAHSKVSPPYFQPWWVGNYPKQGLFLYNRPPHLSRDDEADSKLGSKSGLSRGQDSDSQNRTRPWFQL